MRTPVKKSKKWKKTKKRCVGSDRGRGAGIEIYSASGSGVHLFLEMGVFETGKL